MSSAYQSADALLLCRERSLIIAYCRGFLHEAWTGWAQHHIARCPGCFQAAMRTLDLLEKRPANPPNLTESILIDAEWIAVPREVPRSAVAGSRWLGLMGLPRSGWSPAWLFALSLMVLGFGVFVVLTIHYMR